MSRSSLFPILAIIAVLSSVSCKKIDTVQAGNGVITLSSTLKADGVDLFGRGDKELDETQPWSAYFLVSQAPGVLDDKSAIRVDATIGEEKEFSGCFKDAEPAVLYYFVAMAEQGGKKFNGKEKSFTAPVSKVVFEKDMVYVGVNESIEVKVQVLPENASQDVTWETTNSSIAKVENGIVTGLALGTATLRATSADGVRSATCKVVCRKGVPAAAVDMGLSVYWGRFNVGASSESSSGSYYAYGDTKTRSTYNMDSYEGKYPTPNSGTPYPSLDLKYDAAYSVLGDNWRMPTLFEAEDLIKNSTVSSDQVNGVKGVRLTSTINGHSIFFAFGGYYSGSTYTTTESPSTSGYLRLSTCSNANSSYKVTVYFIRFDDTPSCWVGSEKRDGYTYNSWIYYGLNIRPVYTF